MTRKILTGGGCMDYAALAQELVNTRTDMLQVPASQVLSKLLKGELFVLNYLATHEAAIHPKDLSTKMAVSSARIASLLNHMEEKHYVIRQDDPEDNRQVVVMLTEEGKTAAQQCRTAVISYLSAMLEELGPEDAATYIRIQKKIWDNHRKRIKAG